MNRFSRLLFLLVIHLTLLVLTGQAFAQEEVPYFEESGCPAGLPDDPVIECGYLVVREDRQEVGGETIRLPVYILRSHNPDPAPDPVLFMTRLPGARALPAVHSLAESAILQDRHIIVLEQRGTGLASPSLNCEAGLLIDKAIPCLESLREKGINLEYYTTSAMVSDLEALRQALGFESWNLYGNSFSSQIMLRALEQQQQGIRSLILDSVQPTTANVYEAVSVNYVRALEEIFNQCADDMECQAAYPDLGRRFYSLVQELNSSPIFLEIVNPSTGKPSIVEVDGNWLLAQTYDALYGDISRDQPLGYWPLLISQLEEGNWEYLRPWLANPVVDWEDTLTFGLYYSVLCQDYYPVADADLMASEASTYPELETWSKNAFARQICEAWELPTPSSLSKSAVSSDIPALLLAGSHYPVNPPAWAKEAAETLTSSYYFEFPGRGNWVSVSDPCAQEVVVSFLTDPQSAPAATCLEDSPIGTFVLPKAIYLEPGINRFLNETSLESRNLLQLIALGFSVLLFVAQLIYFVSLLIRQWRSGPIFAGPGRRLALIAHILATLVALLNLGFLLAFRRILVQTASTLPLVLRFGLPAEFGTLFYIPLLAELMTAGLLVITFFIWIVGYWSPPQRIYLSLVTMAAVIFSSFLAYWGLPILS
jgi:pimeloyl-ACP methyl ester carboxylesterase